MPVQQRSASAISVRRVEAVAAVGDQADLAVQSLVPAVGENLRRTVARMPSRCDLSVRTMGMNGLSHGRDARRARRPRADASAGSSRRYRNPQLFTQQERVVERAVAVLHVIQRGELADGLAFGRLEQ
jgi:hypothetical protein